MTGALRSAVHFVRPLKKVLKPGPMVWRAHNKTPLVGRDGWPARPSRRPRLCCNIGDSPSATEQQGPVGPEPYREEPNRAASLANTVKVDDAPQRS